MTKTVYLLSIIFDFYRNLYKTEIQIKKMEGFLWHGKMIFR